MFWVVCALVDKALRLQMVTKLVGRSAYFTPWNLIDAAMFSTYLISAVLRCLSVSAQLEHAGALREIL